MKRQSKKSGKKDSARQKNHGSVFTLLLGNYVIFTLLFVIALCLVFALFLFRVFTTARAIIPGDIEKYRYLLEAGNYSRFPVADIIGDDSFAVIFEQNERVYSSRPTGILFSSRELSLIPDYLDYPSIEVHTLNSDSLSSSTEVIFVTYDDDDSIFSSYIFDRDMRVIYESQPLLIEQMNSREFALFTDTLYSDYSLHRYSFTNQNGIDCVMVLFESISAAQKALGRIGRVLSDSIIGFIFVYCLLIFGFVLWLKPKIKQPLDMLRNALNSFKSGTNATLDYRGPREFVEIVDSFNDMSSRLAQSEQRRSALEADKQRLLADISHDLKTPITVISGYAKALCDDVVPPEEQTQYLRTIEKKAAGLNELINTFYQYSKMEHPDYRLELSSFDICNMLRDYIAEKYSELEYAGAKVSVDIPETHILCKIEPRELSRAFENLLANSISHNPAPITLYISLRYTEADVTILIADDGVGIPENIAASIFEPFVVGEPARTRSGSGLGLAVAKKIVEAHHGKITLLPRRSCQYSTAFEITLPRVEK